MFDVCAFHPGRFCGLVRCHPPSQGEVVEEAVRRASIAVGGVGGGWGGENGSGEGGKVETRVRLDGGGGEVDRRERGTSRDDSGGGEVRVHAGRRKKGTSRGVRGSGQLGGAQIIRRPPTDIIPSRVIDYHMDELDSDESDGTSMEDHGAHRCQAPSGQGAPRTSGTRQRPAPHARKNNTNKKLPPNASSARPSARRPSSQRPSSRRPPSTLLPPKATMKDSYDAHTPLMLVNAQAPHVHGIAHSNSYELPSGNRRRSRRVSCNCVGGHDPANHAHHPVIEARRVSRTVPLKKEKKMKTAPPPSPLCNSSLVSFAPTF